MNIPLFKVFMAPEVGEAVKEVLYSGYIAQGSKVDEFERLLSDWLGVRNLLTVNSGTSSLQLACTLAGVKPGTRVISTPMTCTATNTAIQAVGGEIVWADINPITGNIDPASVDKILWSWRFKEKPVAIMTVDWAGNPCDYKALREIADKYSVKIIEDAAHAFGAQYFGEYLGHVADFTCYSFQAIKHLTTIDGGALICRDKTDYERGKLLRWFGIDRNGPRKDFRCEADVVEPGFKYHMNDVNATVGIYQLPYMNSIVQSHKNNAQYLRQELEPLSGIAFPPTEPYKSSAYWLFTVLVEERNTFMDYMIQHGVTCSQVHARNDTHTMFGKYKANLPGVDEFTDRQCNLPVGWWVTLDDAKHIVETVKGYLS